VTCEIEELAVKGDLGFPLEDDRFQIVIAVIPGDAVDLTEDFPMAVEEELHRGPRIEVGIEVSGISQNIHKPVGNAEREAALHPIDLGLLSWKKCQFMIEDDLAFLSERPGILLDRGIPPCKPVAPESVKDLNGLQARIVRIPLLNQALIGRDHTLALRLPWILGPS
jgi:hypothetical protein